MARNKPPVNMTDRKEQVSLIKSGRENFKHQLWNIDKDWQHGIADQLSLWASDPKAIDIDDFFNEKYISAIVYYKAAKQDPYMMTAWDIALSNIGSRIKNKIRDTFEFSMKHYPKYDTLSRIELEEKREADKATNTVTVYKEETIQIPVFKKKD